MLFSHLGKKNYCAIRWKIHSVSYRCCGHQNFYPSFSKQPLDIDAIVYTLVEMMDSNTMDNSSAQYGIVKSKIAKVSVSFIKMLHQL